MSVKKDSLINELRHFSEKAWQYKGASGIANAVRARRKAGSRIIVFYTSRGYYATESYGASISDFDETVIRSQVFTSKGERVEA